MSKSIKDFQTTYGKPRAYMMHNLHKLSIFDMPNTWETTERTFFSHKHIPIPITHFAQTMKLACGHTYSQLAPIHTLNAFA